MAIAIVIPNVMSSWRACVTTPGVGGGFFLPLDFMPWAALHKRDISLSFVQGLLSDGGALAPSPASSVLSLARLPSQESVRGGP